MPVYRNGVPVYTNADLGTPMPLRVPGIPGSIPEPPEGDVLSQDPVWASILAGGPGVDGGPPAPPPQPGWYDQLKAGLGKAYTPFAPVLDPAQGAVNIGSTGTGGVAAQLGDVFGGEVYQNGMLQGRGTAAAARALEENLGGRSSDLDPLTFSKYAPGPGQVMAEQIAPGPQRGFAGLAKTLGGLAGDIVFDPLTLFGGLAKGKRALAAAAKGIDEFGDVLTAGQRVGQAGRGVFEVASSPTAAAVYGPEVARGVASGVETAFDRTLSSEDRWAAALQAAAMAGLGGAMAVGVGREAKALKRKADQVREVKFKEPKPEVVPQEPALVEPPLQPRLQGAQDELAALADQPNVVEALTKPDLAAKEALARTIPPEEPALPVTKLPEGEAAAFTEFDVTGAERAAAPTGKVPETEAADPMALRAQIEEFHRQNPMGSPVGSSVPGRPPEIQRELDTLYTQHAAAWERVQKDLKDRGWKETDLRLMGDAQALQIWRDKLNPSALNNVQGVSSAVNRAVQPGSSAASSRPPAAPASPTTAQGVPENIPRVTSPEVLDPASIPDSAVLPEVAGVARVPMADWNLQGFGMRSDAVTATDTDSPKILSLIAKQHGVEFPPNGPQFISSGVFHDVWNLGKATQGPLAGKDVIVRMSRARGEGFDLRVPNRPWAIPVIQSIKTPDGFVYDIVPQTYDYGEAGKSLADFNTDYNAMHDTISGDVTTGGENFQIGDLHSGNVRYIKRPSGEFQLVVSDFGGAMDPNVARNIAVRRAEPVGPQTLADINKGEATYSTAKEAEAAALKEARTPPENTVESVRGPDPSAFQRLVKKIRGALTGSASPEARGVVTVARAMLNIRRDGWTPLTGMRFDLSDPVKFAGDLAYAARMFRAPFEIFHAVGFGKDGRVVYHRAFTSGLPNQVNASHPVIAKALRELRELHKQGKITSYTDIHNHPGGMPVPSAADLDFDDYRRNPKSKGYLPGYIGGVITDHKFYGWMGAGSKQGRAVKGARGLFAFDQQKLKVLGPDDPVFVPLKKAGETLQVSGISGYDRGWAERVAIFAKSTFGDSHAPRVIYFTNDGLLRVVEAIPLKTLNDTAWMKKHLAEIQTSTGGGFTVVLHNPLDVRDSQAFQAASFKLLDDESIFDAFSEINPRNRLRLVPGAVNVPKAEGVKRSFGAVEMPFERKAQEGVFNDVDPRKTTERMAEEERTDRLSNRQADPVGSDVLRAAKEAARPVVEGAPPREPPAEARGVNLLDADEKGMAGVLEPDAKPGGSPDVGVNFQKDLKEALPEDAARGIIERFKHINDQLARGKRVPLDVDQMAADAAKFMEEEGGPEAAIAHLKRQGRPLKSKEMFAAWQVAKEKETDAAKLYDKWQSEKTKEAREAWEEGVAESTGYWMFFVNKKTEAARILKALDVFKQGNLDPRLSFFGKLSEGLKAQGVGAKALKELLEVYKNDPAAFPDALRKALKPKWGERLVELWKAGLVSGPATKLANIGSNMLFRGLRDVENALAVGIDIGRVALTGGERERFLGEVGAVWGGYKTVITGPGGAMARWLQNHREILTLQPMTKMLAGEKEGLYRSSSFKGKTGEFVGAPFKSLEADDQFFKHLSAGQEVMRRTYRRAKKEWLADRSIDLRDRYKTYADEMLDVVRHGPDSPHHDKYLKDFEAIQLQALRDTFQLPLDAMGEAVSRFAQSHPLVSLILPFVRTPANIAKETLKRTPGAILFSDFRKTMRGLRKGGPEAGQAAEELSKVLMGSTIGAGLALAAYEGLVTATGGGPIDPKKEANLRETGWQPYSLKVGKSYYSYQRLEPLAGILGMAADMAEAAKQGDTKNAKKLAQRIVGSITDNLTSKTFLSGLEGFFTMWHDPQRYGERWIKQMEASLVPNIVRATARAVDPVHRKTDIGLDPITAGIPGLSSTLPAQTSATGEERRRPGSAIERFASPVVRSEEKQGVAPDVAREMDATGYIPGPVRQFVNGPGGKRIDLTQEERVLLERSRQEATKAVANLLKSRAYRALPANADDPAFRFGGQTRDKILRKVFEKHYERALDKVKYGAYRRVTSGRRPEV